MSLKFGQIILVSHHKERLTSFLSEFFECEVRPVGDGVCLNHEGLNMLIIPAKAEGQESRGQSHTMLDFFVENFEELSQLKQRLEFWAYRINESDMFQSVKLVKLDHQSYFIVKDPDGRSWKFTSKN
jgi:hypothetical protein